LHLYGEHIYVTGRYNTSANVYNHNDENHNDENHNDENHNDENPSIILPNSQQNSMYVVKYNTNGIAEWAITIDGFNSDIGISISNDNNFIYCMGYTETSSVTVWDSISKTTKQLYPSSIESGPTNFILKIDEKCRVSVESKLGLNADISSVDVPENFGGKIPIIINGQTYYIPLLE
jgi:hypothetical protein